MIMDAAPEKKPMPGPGSAISIRDASVYYDTYPALLKTNLDVERGQFVTIVGPNGGGKTTVFKLILGLVKPRSGSVRVLGMPPEAARTSLGYVPQNSSFDPLFPVRVSDIVRMGFLGSAYYPGFRNREDTRARVLRCLQDVGLENRADAWFNSLSGGQKQRVLIARALAGAPEVLLLDEPTSNVDLHAEEMILDMLERLRGKLTVLLVTHYPKVAMRFLDRVYCVNRNVHIHPHTEKMDEDLMRHITGMAPPSVFGATGGGPRHA